MNDLNGWHPMAGKETLYDQFDTVVSDAGDTLIYIGG